METVYSTTRFFSRMLNHILVPGELTLSKISQISRIEISVSDKDGDHVGYLITDIDKNNSLTYLQLSNWAAEKYRDLSD